MAREADNQVADSQPAAVQRPKLEHICLDLQTHKPRYGAAFVEFLRTNREQLNLPAGEDPCQSYLDRVWPDGLPGSLILATIAFDEFFRFRIRPPVDGPAAASFAAGSGAPALCARLQRGVLVVEGFEVVPHVPPRPCEVVVSAQVHLDDADQVMSPADVAALVALPRRKQAAERLDPWRGVLDWRQRLVHLGRLALRYDAWELCGAGRVRFLIHEPQDMARLKHHAGATVLAVPACASQSAERWEPKGRERESSVRVGTVERFEPRDPQVRIRPSAAESGPADEQATIAVLVRGDDADQDMAGLQLPTQGFLVSAVGGDLKPLDNERRAIDRLCKGQGHNPFLADWLYDFKNAGAPATVGDLETGDAETEALNDQQRAAVAKAIAAPDVGLIQGPPGAGKTSVIGAIIRHFAERSRRVLIASQTNLAVDNALQRLSGNPRVRPLRVGKPERVEDEFRGLLADAAVAPWFAAVRQDCARRLERQAQVERRVKMADETLAHLRNVLAQAQELQVRVAGAEQQLDGLRAERDVQRQARAEAARTARRDEGRVKALRELAEWVGGADASPPPGELLADTQTGGLLREAASRIRGPLPQEPWTIGALRAQPDGVSAALAALDAARRARAETTTLAAPLAEALALCAGPSVPPSGAHASRASMLQRERAALLQSEREEDVQRIAQLNRELRELREEGWSSVCQTLRTPLLRVFDGLLPAELEDLTASLRPESTWTPVLEALHAWGAHLQDDVGDVLAQAGPPIQTAATQEALELDAAAKAQREHLGALDQSAAALETQISTLEDQLERDREQLQGRAQRWAALWPEAWLDGETRADVPALAAPALQARATAVAAWRAKHADAGAQDRRWESLLRDWIQRLGDPAAAERATVRAQYVRHANVVGLTCNEAGQRHFYERPDFQPFDVVIVDEVSKATPTELLMPMLLARKVVLVGDQRQLPPLFRERESTYAEAAADGQIDPQDFERYRNLVSSGFFGELFAAAPEGLRQSLFTQYRMHSQIMAVVNQFYDGKLMAGPDETTLDLRRQHHLSVRDKDGGWFLEPHQHLLWLDSSKDQRGIPSFEQQRGSSKANLLEVELVVATLERLNDAARQRGYGPPVTAVVPAREAGRRVSDCVTMLLERPADETVADLFARGRVKLNGRAVRADQPVCAGEQLAVDARKPVAVITFYGAQVGAIRQRLKQVALTALDLRTDTVDRFQGMEQPIVLVSLVRARPMLRGGDYVKQYQRINVALSRAQELLLIIGSVQMFSDALIDLPALDGAKRAPVSAYRNIYELVKNYGGRRYPNQLLR